MAGTGRRHSRSNVLAVAVATAVVSIVAMSAAYACTASASLSASPPLGEAGTPVNLIGNGFQTAAAGGAAVSMRWGGASGALLGTAVPEDSGAVRSTVKVPAVDPGHYIITAVQKVTDNSGTESFVARSVAFEVTGAPQAAVPGAVVPTQPPAAQPAAAAAPATTGQAATTPAPAVQAAKAPQAAVAPAPATPRVRVAPGTPAAAPVSVVAPPAPPADEAPAAVATPAPAVAPAPAVTPAPAPAPAAAPVPERRSVMVSMAGADDNGSPALAIALVGVGLVLATGASALVLAGRREREVPAEARR